MDFLDPKRRKAHKRRLFIGYVLMAIVIGIGTMITLYLAYGYDINRKSGELIQNGIVFVDSKPNGANIYLNGNLESSRTDTRMVLPAGVYTVRLEAEGYRTWERTFNLEGGEIQRLVYPLLIPNTLRISDIAQYETMPQLATQSPDRRWVLVQRPGQTYQFDVYDLSDPERAPVSVAFPITMLTNPSAEAKLEVVEWSNDNRHIAFKRTYESTNEFLIFDRENTNESVNINTALGIKPVEISLKNKRPDQFYYLDASPGVLRVGNTKARTISAPLVQSAIDYKSYGDDVILYASQAKAETGKTEFRVLEGDNDYLLKTVTQAEHYVMDLSKYDNEWYYVVGSAADNQVFVYKDPLPALKQQIQAPLTVMALMRIDNPRFVSFSANTQFISVQSGSRFLSIDLEDGRQYSTTLSHDIPLTQELEWMDGHRLAFVVNQQSYIVDFDGSNENTLVTSGLPNGPFFDRDYDNVFTLEASKRDSSKMALTITVLDDR